MFSRKEQLIQKTGPDGVGRYEFLKQLVNEFNTKTTSLDAKRQILANLANFAYDPINFEYFHQLHIVDVFLNQLSEDDEQLLHFALDGLCNIASDPESKEYIIRINGIKHISENLSHTNEEIAISAITTLYFLFLNKSIPIDAKLHKKLRMYQSSTNPRFKNLGTVFLQTFRHLLVDKEKCFSQDFASSH